MRESVAELRRGQPVSLTEIHERSFKARVELPFQRHYIPSVLAVDSGNARPDVDEYVARGFSAHEPKYAPVLLNVSNHLGTYLRVQWAAVIVHRSSYPGSGAAGGIGCPPRSAVFAGSYPASCDDTEIGTVTPSGKFLTSLQYDPKKSGMSRTFGTIEAEVLKVRDVVYFSGFPGRCR